MSSETIALFCPITSLHIIGNYILAAQGSFLYIYDSLQHFQIFTKHALEGYIVHGLRSKKLDENRAILCVFGEKALRICLIKFTSEIIISWLIETCLFEDLIWDVCWLLSGSNNLFGDGENPEQSNENLALALGHNVILVWNYVSKAILHRVDCQEKCILYSAKFIGNTFENLILAAGTVFNQVILWPAKSHYSTCSKVLHRLTGHQGVIFSIAFNSRLKQLCSTSDDRSLRIWTLVDRENLLNTECLSLDVWERVSIELINVFYGHEARVWSALLLTQYIVSIGEDASCIIWDYNGKVIKKFKTHKSKNIWSLAVNESETILVTGGGDAGIRLWNIDAKTLTDNKTVKELSVDSLKAGDYARSVVLYNTDAVIVVTNEGLLYLQDFTNFSHDIIMNDPSYRSYCGLHLSHDKHFIAICNQVGKVRLFRLEEKLSMQTVELSVCIGKVMNLVWIDSLTFITCSPEGNMSAWTISLSISDFYVDKIATFTLPASKQRWISAAVLMKDWDLLVCGDRSGSIHSYNWNSGKNVEDLILPLQSFYKIHGNAGVTDICFHDNHVFTSGRDGFLRKWNVNDGLMYELNSLKPFKGLEWIGKLLFIDDELFVLAFHTSFFVVWSMSNQQKLFEIQCGGGHRSWDFVLSNKKTAFVYLKSGKVMFSTPIMKSLHENRIVKTSLHGREICDVRNLDSVTSSNNNVHILATGSDDNMINIVAVEEFKPSFYTLGSMQILCSLQGHLSCVRTLCIHSSHHKSDIYTHKLLFSGGGRAELKCWRLKIQRVRPTPAVSHQFVSSHTLGHERKKHHKPWKHSYLTPDTETRIMNLSGFCLEELNQPSLPSFLHLVMAACSDGYLRIFGFNEQSCLFQMIGVSQFHDHCLMKVCSHIVVHPNHSQVIALSAGTDGRVAFWKVNNLMTSYVQQETLKTLRNNSLDDDLDSYSAEIHGKQTNSGFSKPNDCEMEEPDLVMQAHQSGINSMSIKHLKDHFHILLTGGDDGALFVALLHIEPDDINGELCIQSLQTFTNLTAHATQITGVTLLLEKSQIITCAIDQRVCIWQFDWSEYSSRLNVHFLSCHLTNIADIASMDVWFDESSGDHIVAVCGEGLQILRLHNPSAQKQA